MSRTRTWQSRDFWRSVAFKEYRDSREWRYLLALNPSYDIRTRPAAGVIINTSGEIGTGEPQPQTRGKKGTLKLPGMTLAPILSDPTIFTESQPAYFPWDSADEYMDRLGAYTGAALLSRDRTNGFSIDSRQALSDTQRG